MCRYGRGCTHIQDAAHLERFHHPPKRELNPDEIRRNYICNECGVGYDSLFELQFHLQKKTAWSNESLIGSRISCLLDNKEWHEGVVTSFHRSGKHHIEFRSIGEKRWFHMKKLAFYVIETVVGSEKNEYKENSEDQTFSEVSAAQDRSKWTFFEDISFDYAFTQSVLFKIYGSCIQETGHKTLGHLSLTEYDKFIAKSQKGSLLYGELLPRGVNKALDVHHLDASKARILFDMGMGTGKVAIQAFLQYRNLEYVFGVELSVGRYQLAETAALRMVQLLGRDSFHVDVVHGEQITVTELLRESLEGGRTLRLKCGDMLDVLDLYSADIVMMETDIPPHLQFDVCTLLQKQMHEGARILSYHDLFKIWPLPSYPFKQFDINCNLTDRFPTSWSVQRGHHFFLFRKIARNATRIPFHRHLQRSIGSCNSFNKNSSSDSGDEFIKRSKATWPSATHDITTPECSSESNQSFIERSSGGLLSDKDYLEAHTYSSSLPSQPHQTQRLSGDEYWQQHAHTCTRNRSCREQEVEVVDSACCGFSILFNSLFRPSKRKSDSPGAFQPYTASSSSVSGSALSRREFSLRSCRNDMNSMEHSPSFQAMKRSVSPRSVLVASSHEVESKFKQQDKDTEIYPDSDINDHAKNRDVS